jgi:hypothetical protein
MVERLYATLKEAKVEHVVFAGDLFHTIRVEPWILKTLIPLMRRHHSEGMSTTVIAGNHDTGDVSLDASALYYLDRTFCQRVLQPTVHTYTRRTTTGEASIAFAPFVAGSTARDVLKEALHMAEHMKARTVVGHFGVYESGTELARFLKDDPWYLNVDEVFDTVRERFSGDFEVFLGHCHYPNTWCDGEVVIANVGALAPASASECGEGFGKVFTVQSITELGTNSWEQHTEAIPGLRYINELDMAYGDSQGNIGLYVGSDQPSEPLDEVDELTGLLKPGGCYWSPRSAPSREDPTVVDLTNPRTSSVAGAVASYAQACIDSGAVKGSTSGLVREAVSYVYHGNVSEDLTTGPLPYEWWREELDRAR